MFKIFNGMSPDYMHDLFEFQSSGSYTLRSETNSELRLPKFKTNLFKNSLQYSGVIIWNELPINIRKSQSLAIFKRNVEIFLLMKRNDSI